MDFLMWIPVLLYGDSTVGHSNEKPEYRTDFAAISARTGPYSVGDADRQIQTGKLLTILIELSSVDNSFVWLNYSVREKTFNAIKPSVIF